jgi:hypothetical protein
MVESRINILLSPYVCTGLSKKVHKSKVLFNFESSKIKTSLNINK